MKLTARQFDVLWEFANPACNPLRQLPDRLARQLDSGDTHRQGMLLHGLRLVMYRLEAKSFITWESHPTGGKYMGYGVRVTDAGRQALIDHIRLKPGDRVQSSPHSRHASTKGTVERIGIPFVHVLWDGHQTPEPFSPMRLIKINRGG